MARWQRRVGIGFIVVTLVALAITVLLWPFREIILANIFKPDKKEYSASSMENLKALHTAMMLYHDSEGQFPYANGWMDAIENRLQTNDLEKGEGEKKLVRPDLPLNDGHYGYAMNEAASGKYKDDVTDPGKTPLLFESEPTERNAHGDPSKIRTGPAISVDGTLLNEPAR